MEKRNILSGKFQEDRNLARSVRRKAGKVSESSRTSMISQPNSSAGPSLSDLISVRREGMATIFIMLDILRRLFGWKQVLRLCSRGATVGKNSGSQGWGVLDQGFSKGQVESAVENFSCWFSAPKTCGNEFRGSKLVSATIQILPPTPWSLPSCYPRRHKI